MERGGRESFRQILIRFCAPTLAGLKCSNMMSCLITGEILQEMELVRAELIKKGVLIDILYQTPDRMLILVYRKSALAEILKTNVYQQFLREFGYCDFECVHALRRLKARIAADGGQFPHEIGVFLGYPLEDIRGFIENKGRNGLCCGDWKVYHEPEKAKKMFAKLQKCRDVYIRLFQDGRSVMQLTVPV
ncbi:Protein of uncharacterised function (DUF3793) [uncultured Roseburia sp.]|uniref:DUF3793 family protein n=1 Tax=Brotonthovivens ammoniilytica TaxID=2981725 RepID=A0ABT2THZ5_9FIRM|nr:DUF3793 family protein [Brotonthovivens ammoniilytica]MCU6761823.1 DUF3793 family protein [Brotonthovivens ammoniilytica]SCI47747.1 Protein of uncharacterised function (DUF3793) [uncultured Roseburia sp.]